MEHLLERCKNITEISYDFDALKNPIVMEDYWQKKPNWEVINKAQERAKANREKLGLKKDNKK